MSEAGQTSPLVDTHLHLDDPRFEGDRRAVLERAWEAGVRAVVTCSTDAAGAQVALEYARRFGVPPQDGAGRPAARVFAAVGIHPHEAGRVADLGAALRRIEELAITPGAVAIGEIGLDNHYQFAPPAVQRRVFEAQLELARHLGPKPVVIHAREAEDDVLACVERVGAGRLPGVLHAFAGTLDQARRALELGLHLGVGGMMTFKNAANLRAVLASVPLERLVLETDAPYLAPVPHRGRRNEPAFVTRVAAELAGLHGVSAEAAAAATTRAARALFVLEG